MSCEYGKQRGYDYDYNRNSVDERAAEGQYLRHDAIDRYFESRLPDNSDYVISRRSGPKTSPLELGVVLTPLRLLPKAP